MAEQDFLVALADRFRGPRDMILTRLAASYHTFIDALAEIHPQCEAIDLGCGRGEWLELLATRGLRPRGIDLDPALVATCRERGFTAETADALTALSECPTASLAMVSAFHLVEHIPFPVLQQLVREALRVLKPGGLLIMETPNPENLLVSTQRFYLDPTHRNPLPVHLLTFLAEHTGFARVKGLRLYEPPGLLDKPALGLLDVFDGVSPDVAVIAQKAGGPSQMAATAAPFAADPGRMLDALAWRYDQQIVQARAIADRAAARLTQLDQLEQNLRHVEERAIQALADVHASRSWQLTQPLRDAATTIRHLRDRLARLPAVAPAHLLSHVLRRAAASRWVNRHLRPAIDRAPRLKAVLRRLLNPAQPNPALDAARRHWQQSGDFVALGRWTAPTINTDRQIFIDVSEVACYDVRTGVQRVTRSLLKTWCENPPPGYRIEPVYATPHQAGYRYARRYAADLLGRPTAGPDAPIAWQAGDLFIGADLSHLTAIAQRDTYLRMRWEGVRVYFIVYDLLPIFMPHCFLLEPGIHAAWLEVVASCDGALCISRAVADELRGWLAQQGRRRITPLRVEWFHLGADIENSAPSRGLPPDAAAVLERIDAHPAFLMVGTIEPRKGHRQALAAFEQLWAAGADISLVIVGRPGWCMENFLEQLHRHPEKNRRLFWLQQISDEYLEQIYATSVCLIAASEGEGFGLPLIEAARHGLPILARDLPVFREVAGSHASYFHGLDAADLATAIADWRTRQACGQTTQSAGMPWLSWQQSVAQLGQKLFGYPLRDTWYDVDQPEVSLIVLNYDKPVMTLACIESLWEHTGGHRYEILVVDNGSSPENHRLLADHLATGARILRLPTNRFFGEGNNLGAEAARGRYLVFLNNDIAATPDWLSPLIIPLASDPVIGATGPRLVGVDGRLQEAGGRIAPDGMPERYGRDGDPFDPAFNSARDVMYISAAALALRRETFERVLGFDLRYEPAYYEDCDLCLKIAQIGQRIRYCPGATIIHIENATSHNFAGGDQPLQQLVALNRERFLSRWQAVLAQQDGAPVAVPALIPPPAPPLREHPGRPSVLLYTPYPLVPGGGERYLLTCAAALAPVANVSLASPHPWSRLRLRTLGRDLGLELDNIRLATLPSPAAAARPDLAIVMGNELYPAIPGPGRHNHYICQFPFPVPQEQLDRHRHHLDDYERVIVYSPFVQEHYDRKIRAGGGKPPPIDILYPPAPCAAVSSYQPRQPIILGVGRFFTGGHDKRQDLMIEACRKLVARHPGLQLHLVGSVAAEPGHRQWFARLKEQARGLPVHFHPNASPQDLARHYGAASLYWHLAGYGVALDSEPHRCEHFGITVVEAMSAGCIPLVVDRGGPAAIVEDGVTGYHFANLEQLVDLSDRLLSLPATDPTLAALRAAAITASAHYSEARFIAAVRERLAALIGRNHAA